MFDKEVGFNPDDIAFGAEKLDSENVFNFDEPEKPTPSSQEETGKEEKDAKAVEADAEDSKMETDSASHENKQEDVEQRVPYSRFKKKLEEAESYAAKVKALEEKLAGKSTQDIEPSDEVPEEWKQLYGDSELSKKAWTVQQKREAKLREEAVKAAIEMVKKEQAEVAAAEQQKEKALDDYLSSLKDSFGQQMSQAVEEEMLSIVDEFSPTDKEGKYVSLITPEKAIEIYKLRHATKDAKTKAAREKVAELTSGKSQGEAEPSAGPYDPSWDAWRKAL